MSFPDTPFKLESVFVQRNNANTYYAEINISGSDLIIYHNETGSLDADKIDVWVKKYKADIGNNITASWSAHTVSSSYAGTASILLGSVTSASYALSASFAPSSLAISSSYALTSSHALLALSASYFSGSKITASAILVGTILPLGSSVGTVTEPFSTMYAIRFIGTASLASSSFSASYVNSSNIDGAVVSSSYALTASFSLNGGGATSGPTTQSLYATQSLFATQSLYATQSLNSNSSISSSWASSSLSASYAPVEPAYSASVVTQLNSKQATLVTGNTYPITASWSDNSLTASAINFTPLSATSASWASSSLSSSYAGTASVFLGSVTSASYALTASFSLNAGSGTISSSMGTIYGGGFAFTGSAYFNHYTSSYTLTNLDNGKIVSEASASATSGTLSLITVTGSLVPEFSCMIYQSGSGILIITGSDSSVIIRNRAGQTTLAGQYAVASLFRVPNGDFILVGDTLV